MVALRGYSTWRVFIIHVFTWAFADAYKRHGAWEHATLLLPYRGLACVVKVRQLKMEESCMEDKIKPPLPSQVLSKGISDRLSFFSFLAAICVVSIHVPYLRSLRTTLVENGGSILSWLAYFLKWLLTSGIGSSAVPFFFLLSGMFLARHYGEDHWYRRAVQKRVSSILVPYVVFCTFNYLLLRQGAFWWVFGLDLTQYPQVAAYWYLRALFIFVVCSFFCFPLLYRFFLRGSPLMGMAFAYSLCLGLRFVYVYFTSKDLCFALLLGTCRGFVYFLFGSLLARSAPIAFAKGVRQVIVGWSSGLLIAAFVFSFVTVNPYLDGAVSETLIPSVIISAWIIVPEFRVPSVFRKTSFAIYIVHPVIMLTLLGSWIKTQFPTEYVQFVVSMVVGVGGSMLVKIFMDRFLPRFSAIAFGNR